MSADYNETPKQEQPALQSEQLSGRVHRWPNVTGAVPGDVIEAPGQIDFDSDAPLMCSRDQSGDTTCESCQ